MDARTPSGFVLRRNHHLLKCTLGRGLSLESLMVTPGCLPSRMTWLAFAAKFRRVSKFKKVFLPSRMLNTLVSYCHVLGVFKLRKITNCDWLSWTLQNVLFPIKCDFWPLTFWILEIKYVWLCAHACVCGTDRQTNCNPIYSCISSHHYCYYEHYICTAHTHTLKHSFLPSCLINLSHYRCHCHPHRRHHCQNSVLDHPAEQNLRRNRSF